MTTLVVFSALSLFLQGTFGDISIEQGISDTAQKKTIAFSCLAFLTGDMCSSTFFPPGKVSDFFGFQHMRDVVPNGYGHNTEFAGRAAGSVLSILKDEQVQLLVNLANAQTGDVAAYGYKRFVLIEAFQRLLDNDLPNNTNALDVAALKQFTGDLYAIDADISYSRGRVLGGIIAELNDTQQSALWDLRDQFYALFAASNGSIAEEDWPPSSPVDMSNLNNQDDHVLVGTYASQLFSWFTGNVSSDTYFCPERHGTYFGSFYMKDIPPVRSTTAVTIDDQLTANLGSDFLDALDATQQEYVSSIVDLQRDDLLDIVATRQEVSEILRLFTNGVQANYSEVKRLVRHYGELEGHMMYYYASNFAAVGQSLNSSQQSVLDGLRVGYYERFPEYQQNSSIYVCDGAWLYADQQSEMPEIPDTDFLFAWVTPTTEAPATTVSAGCGSFDLEENTTVKNGTHSGPPHAVSDLEGCCSLCAAASSCSVFFFEQAKGECKMFEVAFHKQSKPSVTVGTKSG